MSTINLHYPLFLKGEKLIEVWKTIHTSGSIETGAAWCRNLPIDYPFILPSEIVIWIWKNEFPRPSCYKNVEMDVGNCALHVYRMRANQLGFDDVEEYVKSTTEETRYIHFDKSGFTIKKEGIYPVDYREEHEHCQSITNEWFENTGVPPFCWTASEAGMRIYLRRAETKTSQLGINFCSYLLSYLYKQGDEGDILHLYYRDKVLSEWAEGSEYIPEEVICMLKSLIHGDNKEYIGEENNAILNKWGETNEAAIILKTHTHLAKERMKLAKEARLSTVKK
jgi:hypothetical protein